MIGRGRFVYFAAATMLWATIPCAAADDAATLGFVGSRPAEGRFVEVDGRFMVPYTTKIPGTNVEFTMVPIPPGKLRVEGEVIYYVEIPPFWIGKTEVSWREYHEFMNLDRIFRQFDYIGVRELTKGNEVDAVTAPTVLYDPSFTCEFGCEPGQPALSVRQYAAKQYTKWISLSSGVFYRLPCAVEWTYACRAGSETKYCFGNDASQLDKYAWFQDNTEETWLTGNVGTKLPNRWGIHDMHGNVAEWVLDGYTDESPNIGSGTTISFSEAIRWPTEDWNRMVMGGGLLDPAEHCTSTSYNLSDSVWIENDAEVPASPGWFSADDGMQVGFRIVRPLVAPSRKQQNRFWNPDTPRQKRDIKNQRDRYRIRSGLVDPDLPAAIKNLPENN